jgi:predicted dehydrogenase
MKFIIAGLGSIGRRHLRNLLALGEKDILLYRTHQSTLPDDELMNFPVVQDIDVALSFNPTAVIVSNPTALHLDVAIPAARAGCHLLLEKPISHSMERVDELQDAIAYGGGDVLVGFQFRFHPGIIKTLELVQEDAVGRPLSVRAVYGEYLPAMHPWEDYRVSYSARRDLGGGVILTLSHPIDYLRWILGEVNGLWAYVRQLNDFPIQVEDTAEIGLLFASGVIGSLNLNYNQQPRSHYLEIVGTKGTLRWDNYSGSVSVFRPKVKIVNHEGKGTWETYDIPAEFERNTMFLKEMEHFLEIIRGDAKPVCTIEDGRKALELALAAHRSSHSRQMVEFTG